MKWMRFPAMMCLILAGSGCSTIMHELQPHRLWRWNYQESSGRTDGVYFSVEDPLSPAASPDRHVAARSSVSGDVSTSPQP
jgi:hypothetical protein